ncbi:MAG: class I SAM-dependent methyltransferase [Acidobacteriota bacterium]|nr:class I SAM-dependent methyltransferase [Acidobacteriota bacterium]
MSRYLAGNIPADPDLVRNDPNVVASSFMNYGYEDVDGSAPRLSLKEPDELRRRSIQLYNYVISGLALEGKDVLEVSSGRGGGCRYIYESFGPRSVTGLDRSEASIEFSSMVNPSPNLMFRSGDAEAMVFADASFDVVINVEASHCYGSMDRFLSEVRRVLRPGGIFSWVDARFQEDIPALEEAFARSGLKLLRSADITRNVLQALDDGSDETLTWIRHDVPLLLRPLIESALAVRGTVVFNAFKEGELLYLSRRFESVQP